VREAARSESVRSKTEGVFEKRSIDEQSEIARQVNDAWKQYDKTMKPSVEDMIDVMEQGAKDLASAKGEKFNPTALFDALAEAKKAPLVKSTSGKDLTNTPIQQFENYKGRPLIKKDVRPNLKTTIKKKD
jgi:hypothetical protein